MASILCWSWPIFTLVGLENPILTVCSYPISLPYSNYQKWHCHHVTLTFTTSPPTVFIHQKCGYALCLSLTLQELSNLCPLLIWIYGSMPQLLKASACLWTCTGLPGVFCLVGMSQLRHWMGRSCCAWVAVVWWLVAGFTMPVLRSIVITWQWSTHLGKAAHETLLSMPAFFTSHLHSLWPTWQLSPPTTNLHSIKQMVSCEAY